MTARVLTIGKIGVAYGAQPSTQVERRINTQGYAQAATGSGFAPNRSLSRSPDSTNYPRPRSGTSPVRIGQRMGRIGLTFAPGQGDTGSSDTGGSSDGLSGGIQDVFGPGTQEGVSFAGGQSDTGPVQGSGGGTDTSGGSTDSSGGLSGGIQDVFGNGTQEGVTFAGGATDSNSGGGTAPSGGGTPAPSTGGGGAVVPAGGGNLPTPVVQTQSGLSTGKLLVVGGVVAALAAIVIWRPQWLGLKKHNPSRRRRRKRRG